MKVKKSMVLTSPQATTALPSPEKEKTREDLEKAKHMTRVTEIKNENCLQRMRRSNTKTNVVPISTLLLMTKIFNTTEYSVEDTLKEKHD